MPLLAPASAKTEMFRDRFKLVQQRIMRNKNFNKKLGGNAFNQKDQPTGCAVSGRCSGRLW